MTSYRCPVCGANHKQEPKACRLCGYRMTEGMGSLVTQESGTKPLIKKRSSLRVPMLAGLVGVVVVAVGAVGLGVIDADDDSVDTVVDAIPLLDRSGADGWGTLTLPEQGVSLDFPEVNEQGEFPLSEADGGELATFTARVADTQLTVAYGGVRAGTDDVPERLRELAEAAGIDLEEAELVEDVSVGGLPALQIQVDGEPEPGTFRSTDDFFILLGDQLVLLRSVSPTNNLSPTPEAPDLLERLADSLSPA